MNYDEVRTELDNAPWFGRTPTLARMEALLEHLQLCHYPSRNIIVTGTNGKGSVSAFLHAILRQKYKTGLFTSPHLEEWTERIRVDGEDISRSDFARLYERVREVFSYVERVAGERPTVFERLLAVALLYFGEQQTDINVVEVGIEGPYDSTNLLPAEAVAVASVGLDHTKLLGNTEQEIAAAIGAAFRPRRIAVLGRSSSESLDILEAAARRRRNQVYRYGREFWWDGRFVSFSGSLEFKVNLLGTHQHWNACTAVQTVLALKERGLQVGPRFISAGIEQAQWPGRLEIVRHEPLLLLDGAHNPSAAEVLFNALCELFPGKRWVLIFAAMQDKDWRKVLGPLLSLATRVEVVAMPYERAEKPENIIDFLTALGVPARICTEEEAIETNEDAIAFGSLYLVGDLRRLIRRGV